MTVVYVGAHAYYGLVQELEDMPRHCLIRLSGNLLKSFHLPAIFLGDNYT